MGIEDTLDYNRKFERQTELSAYMQQAHNKAERIKIRDRIKMDDFRGLYGDDNVQKDIKNTFSTIKSFRGTPEEHFAKKTSDVFEVLMFQHIELSDWLGPDASTVLTSVYDDVVNGVDMVTRFNTEDGPRHLALALDVTFGKVKMGHKFDRIKAELNGEKRACQVKYYEDEGQKGVLKEVPRSIIGVSFQTVEQLSALWIDGNKAMLGEHPVQFMILNQLRQQLHTFALYAKDKNPPLASKYMRACKIVMEVDRDKRKSINETRRREIDKIMGNDEIHQLLIKEVEILKEG